MIPIYLKVRQGTKIPNDVVRDQVVTLGSTSLGFNKILSPESSATEVYNTAARELVQNVLDGSDSSIIMFGSARSKGSNDTPGLAIQALRQVFSCIELYNSSADQDEQEQYRKILGDHYAQIHYDTSSLLKRYLVTVSMFEVYKDKIYDLLDEKRAPLEGLWTHPSDGKIRPKGLSMRGVDKVGDAEKVVKAGYGRRRINGSSSIGSASKGCVAVWIEVHEIGSESVASARMAIADLADHQLEISKLGKVLREKKLETNSPKLIKLLTQCHLDDPNHKMAMLMCGDFEFEPRSLAVMFRSLQTESKSMLMEARTVQKPQSKVRIISSSTQNSDYIQQMVAELEIKIRQEVASDYNTVIANIEANNQMLLKQLENANTQFSDGKLEIFAQETQQRLSELMTKNGLLISQNQQLKFQQHMDSKTVQELEEQILSFNNENIKLRHENEKLSQLVVQYEQKLASMNDKLNVKTEKMKTLMDRMQRQTKNRNILRDSLDSATNIRLSPVKGRDLSPKLALRRSKCK